MEYVDRENNWALLGSNSSMTWVSFFLFFPYFLASRNLDTRLNASRGHRRWWRSWRYPTERFATLETRYSSIDKFYSDQKRQSAVFRSTRSQLLGFKICRITFLKNHKFRRFPGSSRIVKKPVGFWGFPDRTFHNFGNPKICGFWVAIKYWGRFGRVQIVKESVGLSAFNKKEEEEFQQCDYLCWSCYPTSPFRNFDALDSSHDIPELC